MSKTKNTTQDTPATVSSFPVTQEQIKAWKQEYGDNSILKIKLRGDVVYLLDPEKSKNYFHMAKRTLQFLLKDDIGGAGEVVFNECYLGGLGKIDSIDTNAPIYFDACYYAGQLMEVAKGSFTRA